MSDALDAEVDANFEAFQSQLPQILASHPGQYVLMRHERCEAFFEDLRSAMDAGLARFDDRIFSIQEITDRPVDLGFFSHAVNPWIA